MFIDAWWSVKLDIIRLSIEYVSNFVILHYKYKLGQILKICGDVRERRQEKDISSEIRTPIL